MDDATLVEESLKALGGEKEYVPGAKLLQAVQRKSLESGSDFRKSLQATGKKFSDYLETLAPRIRVHKRGAADMLVGFADATLEVPRTKRGSEYQFRGDVYSAFGRVSKLPFFYDPKDDRFAHKASDTIAVPPIATSDLLLSRKAFAESCTDDTKKAALLEALSAERPLTAFREATNQANLSDEWQLHKNRQMRSAVERWASDSNIKIRDSWFASAPEIGLKSVLVRLAGLMNEDELKSLAVPLRVVELYLRQNS